MMITSLRFLAVKAFEFLKSFNWNIYIPFFHFFLAKTTTDNGQNTILLALESFRLRCAKKKKVQLIGLVWSQTKYRFCIWMHCKKKIFKKKDNVKNFKVRDCEMYMYVKLWNVHVWHSTAWVDTNGLPQLEECTKLHDSWSHTKQEVGNIMA